MSYYINWSQSGNIITGKSGSNWITGNIIYPINYPGGVTEPQSVSLQSSSLLNNQNYILKNIYLYLTGEDANIVQTIWPTLGSTSIPVRPELSGGFEISFDGVNWIRFNSSVGLESNRSTWLILSSESTGNGVDGQLGPLDVANIMLRYVIPPGISLYKVLDINLGIIFEVV